VEKYLVQIMLVKSKHIFLHLSAWENPHNTKYKEEGNRKAILACIMPGDRGNNESSFFGLQVCQGSLGVCSSTLEQQIGASPKLSRDL